MRLAQWRIEQGWTQSDLAERLGITQPAVSYFERASNPLVPKPPLMVAIYLLSRGRVQPNDFYDLPPIEDHFELEEAA